MDEELRWNLDGILKVEDFDKVYDEVDQSLVKFQKYFKQLRPNMSKKKFKEFVEFDERVSELFDRLGSLPALISSTDVESEEAQLMGSKLKDLAMKFTPLSTKISHWLKGKEIKGKKILDDENAKRLFSAVPDLEYVYQHMREGAKYTLSEPEENVITVKNMLVKSPLVEMREQIESGFKFYFMPKGADKVKIIETVSELVTYVRSANPNEREAAYTTLLKKYEKNLTKFFSIYQAVVKDMDHFSKQRGYKSPIFVRNRSNDVPDEAIATLLKVCSENRDIFQGYFKWKAKELGMEKLRRFDIYAPLKGAETEKIPFSEAKRMVLEVFASFSENFAEKAKSLFEAGHIDSHPRKNKQGGAFCMTVAPSIVPYNLLNYTGEIRDIAVMAHELGHAIHSLYATHHSLSSQNANLPLAETASTFAEMVMFEKQLAEANSDEVRKIMLSDKIADSYATIVRQCYLVKFEIKAHEAITNGIKASGLSELCLETLKEQFGDSVSIDPLFKHEWAYIPHIVHSPFYCYAYSFGELLSLSLYSRYKEEGQGFIPKIEKILASGGSRDPQEVLKEVNVDMNSRDFWQGSFDIVGEWQNQLKNYK